MGRVKVEKAAQSFWDQMKDTKLMSKGLGDYTVQAQTLVIQCIGNKFKVIA